MVEMPLGYQKTNPIKSKTMVGTINAGSLARCRNSRCIDLAPLALDISKGKADSLIWLERIRARTPQIEEIPNKTSYPVPSGKYCFPLACKKSPQGRTNRHTDWYC